MGVVKNYGDTSPISVHPFPAVYPFTLPTDLKENTTWNFNSWVPHAVVINLGTNDFSAEPYPTQEEFELGFYKFVKYIAARYQPSPAFFLSCGPLASGFSCGYILNVTSILSDTLNAHYIDLQHILTSDELGCAYHPNIKGHRKMADIIRSVIRAVLNWYD